MLNYILFYLYYLYYLLFLVNAFVIPHHPSPRPVVDETTFLRRALRHLESQTINIALRLAQSHKARTEENAEDLSQAELFNPVVIQFSRLVIDGSHKIFARTTQRTGKGQHIGERLTQPEHEVTKFRRSKGARPIKNSLVEILVKRDLPTFEIRNPSLVPGAKLVLVQVEVLQCLGAFGVIPRVAEQYTADIPENAANGRQDPSSLSAVA